MKWYNVNKSVKNRWPEILMDACTSKSQIDMKVDSLSETNACQAKLVRFKIKRQKLNYL